MTRKSLHISFTVGEATIIKSNILLCTLTVVKALCLINLQKQITYNIFQQLVLKFIFDDSRRAHSFHSTVKACQHDICCNMTILYSKTRLKMDVRECKSSISAFLCSHVFRER